MIPRIDGFLQPMHAVVDRHAAIDAIEMAVSRGEQRLFRVLEALGPRIVEAAELREVDPELHTLFNVNTAEDVAHAEHPRQAADVNEGGAEALLNWLLVGEYGRVEHGTGPFVCRDQIPSS